MEFFIGAVLLALGLVFLIAGVNGNAVGLWAATLGRGVELPLSGVISGHGSIAGGGGSQPPVPLPREPLHKRGSLPLPGPHPVPVPR